MTLLLVIKDIGTSRIGESRQKIKGKYYNQGNRIFSWVHTLPIVR